MRTIVFGLAILIASLGAFCGRVDAASENENMAQQIAQNLKESGKLKGYRVGVKYEDGVAWLRGTVTSPQQKSIAEQIARTSPGVDHVVSKLDIVPVEGNQPEMHVSFQEPVGNPTNGKPLAKPTSRSASSNMPVPYAYTGQGQNVQAASYSQQAQYCPDGGCMDGGAGYVPSAGGGAAYDNPQMPGYAWPSYAASPNYAALTYPKQYSASAWPYIGPFYPYPQVPLGWRKVTLEWDDGWWFLDFNDCKHCK
jgi:BON domain